ncbi:MAG: FCD domain-containing protein, partial [Acidimicrobiia bacterium]
EEEPHSAAWVDFNRTFHLAIFETAATPRLVSIIRGLQDASVMYIGASLKLVPNLRDEANRDHAAILAALEARDADAAVEAILKHLTVPLKALESRLAGQPKG